MASSSGTSSFSASWEQKKRKRMRMISNKESARRSRLRNQKHLDDLTAEVEELRKKNHQIAAHVSTISCSYLILEEENSILAVQKDELGHRLRSLNEIIEFLNVSNEVFRVWR